jgi:hypothetical protein
MGYINVPITHAFISVCVFYIMTDIGANAGYAFDNGYNFNQANTMVNRGVLRLHGNMIAKHDDNGKTMISLAGWNSHTTKERLNNLRGVSIHQKDFQLYLNGEPINSQDLYIVSP